MPIDANDDKRHGVHVYRAFAPLLLVTAVALIFIRLKNRGSFIYHPAPLAAGELRELAAVPGWHVDRVEADPSVVLVGLARAPSRPDEPFILFFPGNGEHELRSGQDFCEGVGAQFGCATFAFRGFDASSGRPGPNAFHGDALIISKHVADRYGAPPGKVHLVGFSMGSEVAFWLGAELSRRGTPPPSITLLSSYTPPYRMIRYPGKSLFWPLSDHYDPASQIADVRSPILVIHGTKDDLCPIDQARDLARRLGKRARLVEIPGGHPSTRGHDAWSAIAGFVRNHG